MERSILPREVKNGEVFLPDSITHAYSNYTKNIRRLEALLAMVFPILDDETERSIKYLNARRYKIENDFAGPWIIDVNATMLSWQVAMRVSAFEVYLQDVLTLLALYDPDFIRSRKSKQEWDYDSIREVSDSDSALIAFCNRWAKSFVSDGGPKRWMDSLGRSGIGKHSDEDIKHMEGMWGYRHSTVHNESKLLPDFLNRHPELYEELEKEGVTIVRLKSWTELNNRIADSIETSIVSRLRAKVGAKELEERSQKAFERVVDLMNEWNSKTESEPFEEREARITGYEEAQREQWKMIDELFR